MERETQSLVRGAPTESRADEARQKEPPGDGEPAPDTHVTSDAIELRSHLAVSLRPSAFPGDRERLVAVAEEEFADDAAMAMLRALPPDREFRNVEDVWVALGGETERRVTPAPARPRRAENRASEAEGEPAGAGEDESLWGRIRSVAVTGLEFALGLAVVTIREVRRRL